MSTLITQIPPPKSAHRQCPPSTAAPTRTTAGSSRQRRRKRRPRRDSRCARDPGIDLARRDPWTAAGCVSVGVAGQRGSGYVCACACVCGQKGVRRGRRFTAGARQNQKRFVWVWLNGCDGGGCRSWWLPDGRARENGSERNAAQWRVGPRTHKRARARAYAHLHAYAHIRTHAPDLHIDNFVLDLERLEREFDADRRVVLLGRRNVVHVPLDETRLAWTAPHEIPNQIGPKRKHENAKWNNSCVPFPNAKF